MTVRVPPATVEEILGRPGCEWSAGMRNAVLAWLFADPQMIRLLRLAHVSLGYARATPADAEDAWAEFCAGAASDEGWENLRRLWSTKEPMPEGTSEIDDKMLRYDPKRSPFIVYLRFCFKRYCYHRGAKIARHAYLFDGVAGSDPATRVSPPELCALREALRDCLAVLSPLARRVVILPIVQGMKDSETAVIVGKTTGALRVMRFRALHQLRECLKAKGCVP